MLALLLLLSTACAHAQVLPGYLPPVAGFATGGELGPAFAVPDAPSCAAACDARSDCISFSAGAGLGLRTCGIAEECYAPNASSCPSTLAFSCPGGVFSAVQFASFGLPRVLPGSCAFAANASCDAPSAAAVAAAACLGRSLCSIEVSVGTFGSDPCSGVVKFAAVSLAGNCSDAPASGLTCQLSGYSRTYTIANTSGVANATMAYYQRLQPRNDAPAVQAIPYALNVPTAGVALTGGVLAAASDAAVHYLTTTYTVDNLLFTFQ